ncbi:hypothetical protein SI65_06011 [Aspergillus cristatus]|uniref:Uncharacterized protein n=1 Tax=Aspergillus cristatus TaxID=573508 RepID=A0A1E3BAY4_ASPCR|nr:hypothetical protein SI65_06011 [Aspergillus cristatus]
MANRKFTLKAVLVPDTSDEFSYHIKNYGVLQRTQITGHDRTEAITVTGELADVVHGHMGDDGSKRCTLIVFDWWIDGHNENKRFKHVQIRATFKSEAGGAWYDPQVIGMAPRGTFSMLQSKHPVNGHLNVGLSSQTPPALGSFGFTLGYESTTSTERQDFIKIIGRIRVGSDSKGSGTRPNEVQWDVDENALMKSGLPSYFRTAVLLERNDDSRFIAQFSIETKADMLTELASQVRELMGRNPKDEPVIFDPEQQSTSSAISPSNMESWKNKLLELCTFTPHTGKVAQTGEGVPET